MDSWRIRPMSRKQMIVLGVAVPLLVVAAYLVGSQRQSAATAQRLAEMEQRQHALESGVLNGVPRAQLASQLGYAPQPPAPDQRERKQLTPAEAAQALQDKLAAMDRQFRSEPVDPKWAGEAQKSVEDSVVGAAADSGVQPASFSADCRSKSCMINMEVGSGGDMDRMLEAFTTEVSGKLPVTTMIPITGPDGKVTMRILGTQSTPNASSPPRG